MKTHSIITGLTALFLAFTLFFSTNFNALSKVQATTINEENTILGKTNYCCKLRKEPLKSSEAVITLPESTLLYITGSTSNSHGNVWIETSHFGDTVYCYSGNVREYEHDFTFLVNNEDSTYAYRCGTLDTEVD